MTQTALLADKDQHITLFNIFTRSIKNATASDVVESAPTKTEESPLLTWFEKSKFLKVVDTKTLSAGKIFQVGHVIVNFKLSNLYQDRFILLRGLLEFSRPRQISISSNTSERTFQLRVAEDQIDAVKIYLDTILELLIKEIKFKASLNLVLKFEQSVKEQQSTLYEALRALA